MSLIQVSHVSFAYEGSYDNVFTDVSFQLDTDWRLAFAGRNGRGKTTFLKLLMGEYPYQGSISHSVDFVYFPFSADDPSRPVLEVLTPLNPHCPHWQLVRELSLLELDEELLYRPFSTLSSGEQTKVFLAVLFLRENSFLLIDEPTNHLDANARRLVSRYLRTKKGFILVSHDRTFLDGCVDHILSINRNNVELQKGNFSSWWQNKQLQDQFALSENDKLKADISRLTVAAKRTSGWSDQLEKTKNGTRNSGLRPDRGFIGHKSAKMMKRAKTIEQRQQSAIARKEGLLNNLDSAEPLKLSPLRHHADRLVTLKDISIFYGDKQACKDINLVVCQGDRILLRGKNGCGKSSILKLICGEELSYTGHFEKASQLIISYLPQDASFLRGTLSDYATCRQIDESLFKAILRKLDFSRVQLEKDMADFSGGQKKKVLLAASLCEKAHLYIWDEPLNYIDVFSRIQLEELFLQAMPTMLFVEHDQSFADKVATKVVLR